MPIVHGGVPSPFVKKVCAFLAEEGVAYELRSLAPFPKTPELLAMNPLGKIPIYQDGDLMLPDSSVICAYVERVYPKPALDWIESQVASGVLGGALSIADIAVAAQLANFRLAGEKIDGARWPKLAAWAERTLARPSFAKLLEGGAFPG